MKPVPSSVLATATLVAMTVATASAQAPQDALLGVRKIVLYKHGIGYFERQGTVDGSADVALSFKSAQMKDVLKSLYAVDRDGGRIATVIYDSKDPIQKQLEDILFRVPDGAALTQFLAQLKGARVTLSVGSRTVTGSILGIEPVVETTDGGTTVTRHKLVVLAENGVIENLDLMQATGLQILDETVQRDLARMMDIYAKARYADRKSVRLRAEGEGQRRLQVGYIIETPIWKTSYRLLLDGEQPPLLQGWAIVENRTDEDWKDVQLTFVAGSPLSFVLDLYTSYYPARPILDMGIGAAESLNFEAAKAGRPAPAAPRSPSARRALGAFTAEREVLADAEAAPEPSLGELFASSMAPAAQGVAVGDLFEYQARGPVTIQQGQAALVPILLEKVAQSRRVVHWRADLHRFPQNAVWLTNGTALTLERGPVTVFEGAACRGEAMLTRTLKPGMDEILAFALETAVEVEPRGDTHAKPITRATIADGVLMLFSSQTHETRYKLRNKSGKAHTLVLDHQKLGGQFRLVEPAKPTAELPAHYRFTVDLAVGAETEFVVREEQPVRSDVSLLGSDVEQLRVHVSQPYLSQAAREFLAKIATTMTDRAVRQRTIARLNDERARLLRDQEEVRRNMQVLRDSPEERRLRDQYVERLTKGMQRLDELDATLATEQQKVQELDAALATAIVSFRE